MVKKDLKDRVALRPGRLELATYGLEVDPRLDPAAVANDIVHLHSRVLGGTQTNSGGRRLVPDDVSQTDHQCALERYPLTKVRQGGTRDQQNRSV